MSGKLEICFFWTIRSLNIYGTSPKASTNHSLHISQNVFFLFCSQQTPVWVVQCSTVSREEICQANLSCRETDPSPKDEPPQWNHTPPFKITKLCSEYTSTDSECEWLLLQTRSEITPRPRFHPAHEKIQSTTHQTWKQGKHPNLYNWWNLSQVLFMKDHLFRWSFQTAKRCEHLFRGCTHLGILVLCGVTHWQYPNEYKISTHFFHPF